VQAAPPKLIFFLTTVPNFAFDFVEGITGKINSMTK
jgi:hypothetical protein